MYIKEEILNAIFVCVNYNNSNETINYIKHINTNLENINFHIVVVDNSENEFEFIKLMYFKNSFKNVFIIKADKNLGYFTGMQYGIDFYTKNIGDLPKVIVICNTDIIINSKNILNLSSNVFENEEDIAIIAPKIILKKNLKEQNPFLINRPSCKKLKFLKFVYSNQFSNNFYNFLYRSTKVSLRIKSKKDILTNRNIYAPHGSFIIINNAFFKKGGSLHYKGFLFGEEIYLGEQVLNLEMKIKYFPKIVVIHNENSVTKFIEKSKKRLLKLNSIKFLINYLYSI